MLSFKSGLLLLALLMLTSCASRGKPIAVPSPPIAGCSERAIALTPPPPPDSDDYRLWARAYTGAVGAYEDSENKRAATADCLDSHKVDTSKWWSRYGRTK